jgi:hypothetical protein
MKLSLSDKQASPSGKTRSHAREGRRSVGLSRMIGGKQRSWSSLTRANRRQRRLALRFGKRDYALQAAVLHHGARMSQGHYTTIGNVEVRASLVNTALAQESIMTAQAFCSMTSMYKQLMMWQRDWRKSRRLFTFWSTKLCL